jgi:hypothetical protein
VSGRRVKALRRQIYWDLVRALGREPRRSELPTAGDVRRLKRAWRKRGQPAAVAPRDQRWTRQRDRRRTARWLKAQAQGADV